MKCAKPEGNLRSRQSHRSLAEFERDIIKERTKAGLEAARARGRKGGHPFKLTGKKREMARALYQAKTHTIKDLCQMLGVSRATLYRAIKA